MVEVASFDPSQRPVWDKFVLDSKKPAFFFMRDYMEYHADRFHDGSLVVTHDGDVIALLPATRDGSTLVSHGGLTFGGLLTSRSARSDVAATALHAIVSFLGKQGVATLRYKAIPHIFHAQPAEEDEYFLVNQLGAKLVRRDLSSVVDLNDRLKLSKGRRALLSRGRQAQVEIKPSTDWVAFHGLLSGVLSRHGTAPVHSAAELAYLAGKFPTQIQLHVAMRDAELLAATLLFGFGRVTHTQYMAVSEQGKELGALDLLIDQQITSAAQNSRYFSFGISTEQNGKVLNEGLLAQKESFGARSIVIDTYEVTVS